MMLPVRRWIAIQAAAPTYSAVPTMMSVIAAHCHGRNASVKSRSKSGAAYAALADVVPVWVRLPPHCITHLGVYRADPGMKHAGCCVAQRIGIQRTQLRVTACRAARPCAFEGTPDS